MRWLTAALLFTFACDDSADVSLGDARTCSSEQPCASGSTCLAGECVRDGSLVFGDSCNHEAQCGAALICHNFICKNGCSDVYYLDDCADPLWCKPVPGATIPTSDGEIPAGSCAPSECDPAEGERCEDGSACVAIAPHIGACLPYCEYGFMGDDYVDRCEDGFTNDLSCQPLGLNHIPVCLTPGDAGAPAVGEPGCDAIRNPCSAGAICVNVVCRALCTPGQADPCPAGESCTPVADRTDVAYCRAD
jgi:hypothetical protein